MKGSESSEKKAVVRYLLPALLLVVSNVALLGCGQLIQPPTPTAAAKVSVTATDTPWPTATRRATFTPVPATPSDTPTPTATATPIIYVIQKGDTLLPIARKYGVSVQAIQEANGISDPRRLSIGQEIIIPALEGNREPTAVPTPTPVALQISGLAFYRTPVDTLWCLGEVVNVSGRPAEEIQVQVSLHDEQGTLLASAQAFSELHILAAEGRAPFAILFTAPPGNFAQYQTRVVGGVPSTHLGPRYTDLVIVDHWGGWLDENTYQVRGEVQNSGQAEAEQVALVVTLYDQQDHVVGARTVEVAADVFLPGAIAPFEVTLTPLGDVARYEAQVQGWWIGYEVPQATDTPSPTPTR